MQRYIILTHEDVQPYAAGANIGRFPDLLAAFIKHQCTTWPELAYARGALSSSMTRRIVLREREVMLQHIPHRITSSSSRVDHEYIAQRPCFLCPDMLYEQQRALPFRDAWLVLNNPFPIFPDHLVIVHRRHLPQRIDACLAAMIDFVQDTACAYTAFYNGPACGASAPDHLHFQACPDGGIPLTRQLDDLTSSPSFSCIATDGESRWYIGELDCRALFVCIARHPEKLAAAMTCVVQYLEQKTGHTPEPMVNVIITKVPPHRHIPPHAPTPVDHGSVKTTTDADTYNNAADSYMGIIAPRKAHRPVCFFKSGTDNLMVSPGAVDIGGRLILPRHDDFHRMNRDLVLEIFSEVCFGKTIFDDLCLYRDRVKTGKSATPLPYT
ncbi:MAG: DUF4922 domain-containing protein [Desulfobacterota bacterium]|nr:DUF4922 domain-containing protein [Thermodesulfobacteriota bacterium]